MRRKRPFSHQKSKLAARRRRARRSLSACQLGYEPLEPRQMLAANLTLLEPGLKQILGEIQSEITDEVFGNSMPLVGAALKTATGAAVAASLQGLLDTSTNTTIADIISELKNDKHFGTALESITAIGDDKSDDIAFNIKLTKEVDFHVPFNTGLPALGISFNDKDINVKLGFDLETQIGVDKDGFYLNTANSSQELELSLDVTAPGLEVGGDFGLLEITAKDKGSSLDGTFTIDLKREGGDGKLRGGELSKLDADAKFSAAALIDLGLTAKFGGDFVINPELSANLYIKWDFNNANPESSFASFGGAPLIEVKNVGINVGPLFKSLVAPIVERMSGIAEPFVEIVDGLNQQVLPNQDLIKLTYLDLYKLASASADGADVEGAGIEGLTGIINGFGIGKKEDFTFLDLVVKLVDLYKKAQQVAGGTVPLGSFKISDPRPAGFVPSIVNPVAAAGALGTIRNMAGDFFALADQFTTKATSGSGSGGGFRLDIVEDTNNAFKLFVGDKSAQVFTFSLPKLDKGFYKSHEVNFLLFGFPITFGFAAGINLHAGLRGGFDGAGLAKFRSSDKVIDILDGFYLETTDPFLRLTGRDEFGKDTAQLFNAFGGLGWNEKFSAQFGSSDLGVSVGIGAELSGHILTVNGDLTAQPAKSGKPGIEFDFDDPTKDGRLRFSDMAHDVNEGLECLFEISGGVDWNISLLTKLAASFKVAVEIDIETPFGDVEAGIGFEVSVEPINHTWAEDGGELFSLDFQCPDDATSEQIAKAVLAKKEGDGQLVLLVGERANERNVSPNEINENYVVRHDGGSKDDESVTVYAFGAKQSFTGIKSILAVAHNGNDVIEIAPEVLSSAIITGGDGEDKLTLGNGGGMLFGGPHRDFLYGGTGKDSISGQEGDDEIYGRGGDDSLFGGPDNDLIAGDDGHDILTGESGNDKFYGGGGIDTVRELDNVNFSLTSTTLQGLGSDTLSQVEKADLETTTGDNVFTVSKWGGEAVLKGGGGNDTYKVTFNTTPKGTVAITDSLGTADKLEVYGTSNADTIDVVTGKISRGPQFVSYTGIESVTVDGREENDNIKVGSTSGAPLKVVGHFGKDLIEVGLGNLSAIQAAVVVEGGTNLDKLIVSDAQDMTANTGLLVAGKLTGLGMGPAGIVFDAPTDDIEILLGSGNDDFLAEAVLRTRHVGRTGTSIFSGAGNDLISVGSRAATNQGDLDAIQTKLLIFGEADNGGGIETRDRIYINDRKKLQKFNYKLTPTSLTDDPNLKASPAPPARTFDGINYDGTTEFLRLDGTDAANQFDVGPSRTTKYFIDGNLPAPGTVAPDRGDFLKLDTKTIPAPDRLLGITSRGSGSWTFPETKLQDVQFESIEKFNHVDIIAVGSDVASQGTSKPSVLVYDAENNRLKFRIAAASTYGTSNKYGIRLTTADIDGDGLPDVITAPGRTTRPDIKVFLGTPQAGLTGKLYTTLAANNTYGTSFKDGVNITAGDVDGDAMPEVILAPERGAANIKVYHNQVLEAAGSTSPLKTSARTFNAFSDMKSYIGGATLAVGNLDGDIDNVLELIVGTGAGVAAKVRTFNLVGANPVTLRTINHPTSFNKGLFVSAGDVDGDGKAEIVMACGSGGASWVHVFSAAGVQRNAFQAFPAAAEVPNAPVRITMRDCNDDGRADIVAMQGQDGRSGYRMKKFNALTGAIVDALFATDPDFAGGGVNLG
jgi:Ca2+-binding RTX toxin-like protein